MVDDRQVERLKIANGRLCDLVNGVGIVLCKSCKHYMDYEHEYEPNLGYCRYHDKEEVRDSCFCAWGERKEGGDD